MKVSVETYVVNNTLVCCIISLLGVVVVGGERGEEGEGLDEKVKDGE